MNRRDRRARLKALRAAAKARKSRPRTRRDDPNRLEMPSIAELRASPLGRLLRVEDFGEADRRGRRRYLVTVALVLVAAGVLALVNL